MEGWDKKECVVSIRIGLLIGLFMLLWLRSRYSVIMASAQKFQTCAVRSPSPSRALDRSRARPRRRSKKRRSQESECQYCPFGLRILPPPFLSFLPLSSSSLERKFRIGFRIHFHRFMRCCKKRPFYRILTQEGTRDTIQSRPQTCHGTRLARS